jgi:tRNA-(ms[2]io[6]A)-hydroxylase
VTKIASLNETYYGQLQVKSSDHWLATVLADFDTFLLDHAANERKASAMAMSMVAHYPDKPDVLNAMIDLALEELNHFRQVVKLMQNFGLQPAGDEKDPYVNQIRKHLRDGKDHYFLDRLLSAAVIEARGAERFGRIAEADVSSEICVFYRTLARSEQNHHHLFINLALNYFSKDEVCSRLDDWLAIEAEVLSNIKVRARLH